MDSRRADLLIQYALATAGQEDEGDRELGPIHLLKYAYLADLTFAESHEGRTFTGTPWRFYHFGPWSAEVHARIKPAVEAIHARERRFDVPGWDDGVRWHTDDETLLRSLEHKLPREIGRCLKEVVHKFGSDTAGLLHYVYRTEPMLRAAPGETLDLTLRQEPDQRVRRIEQPEPTVIPRPRRSALRRQQEASAALRERVATRVAERRGKYVAPDPPPRYDTVFNEGVAWLDSLEGEQPEPESGELTFSDDIWKSRSRGEADLSD